jgi:glycosyltransferase involved in cell wall biosynthesis
VISTEVQPHLLWIYPGDLDKALDAATWLVTTDELRLMGWQVTLVTAGPSGTRMIGNTEVYGIPMPHAYLLRQIAFHLGFYFLLARQKPGVDIILCEQMTAPWLLPLRFIRGVLRKHRPLFVMDIRSLHMVSQNDQDLKGWLRGKYKELVNRLARQWVDGNTAITRRMADFLKISKDQLWGVWPSGVSLELFQGEQQTRIWPSENDRVRLVYIGTMNFERNLLNLCQAVEEANADGMRFDLWLIGDGDQRIELENYATRTCNRISVRKPVPHSEVPNLLAQAHIGVLPFPDETKFRVSSPIKLFEYMAAGMPILASRIVCHTDVVGDGDYVFWADQTSMNSLLSALRDVWQNRETLRFKGARSALAAELWTWRTSAMKLKKSLEYGLATHPNRIARKLW